MKTRSNGLYTAPLCQPVTVFLVGVQCRSWLSAWKLPFIGRRMGKMQQELQSDPDSGLIWGANFFQFSPLTTLYFSYWRSAEHIHRFVESNHYSHKKASPEYFRRWGNDPHLGVWHETYDIAPGKEENLYFNMAPLGASAFNEIVLINATNKKYLTRLKRS